MLAKSIFRFLIMISIQRIQLLQTDLIFLHKVSCVTLWTIVWLSKANSFYSISSCILFIFLAFIKLSGHSFHLKHFDNSIKNSTFVFKHFLTESDDKFMQGQKMCSSRASTFVQHRLGVFLLRSDLKEFFYKDLQIRKVIVSLFQ